jgi:hypothetical protein
MKSLRLIPTRGGIVYECPECEERFLPALADNHVCEVDESFRDDLPAWEDPTPSMPFPVFTTMFNRMGGF